jgi:hypothetical protein
MQSSFYLLFFCSGKRENARQDILKEAKEITLTNDKPRKTDHPLFIHCNLFHQMQQVSGEILSPCKIRLQRPKLTKKPIDYLCDKKSLPCRKINFMKFLRKPALKRCKPIFSKPLTRSGCSLLPDISGILIP